jgi:hypothetical protein
MQNRSTVAVAALVALFVSTAARGQSAAATPTIEENRGQRDPRIKYCAQGVPFALTFEKDGATLKVGTADDFDTVRLLFARTSGMQGEQRLPLITRYKFTGTSNYQVGAPHFAMLRYRGLADNVDAVFSPAKDAVPVRFVIWPGGDATEARLQIAGAMKMTVEEDGSLVVQLRRGRMLAGAPVAYQIIHGIKVELPSQYVVTGNTLQVEVKKYEKVHDLIVDARLQLIGKFDTVDQLARTPGR